MKNQFKMNLIEQGDDKFYQDSKGNLMRLDGLKAHEKKESKTAFVLANEAFRLFGWLKDFKSKAFEQAYEVHKAKCIAKGFTEDTMPPLKNFTIESADGQVRVKVSNHSVVTFDDSLLAMAQQKFTQYIKEGLTGSSNDFLRDLILGTLAKNSKGNIDKAKVDTLLSYRNKTDDQLFLEALDLLAEAKKISDTKQYINVYQRNDKDGYDIIPLNISAV